MAVIFKSSPWPILRINLFVIFARCPSPGARSHRGAANLFNKAYLSHLFLLNTLVLENGSSTGILAKQSRDKKSRHPVQDSSSVASVARFNQGR